MKLYKCNSILDTLKLILLNDREFMRYSRNNNQCGSIIPEEENLDNLVQDYTQERNLNKIAGGFATSYNIYLYFIAPDEEGVVRIINEDFSPESIEQKRRAFVLLNREHTIWKLLYADDRFTSKKKFVFTFDDSVTTDKVKEYIQELNILGMSFFDTKWISFHYFLIADYIQSNPLLAAYNNPSNGKK